MAENETNVDLYGKMESITARIAIYGAPNSTRSSDNSKVDEVDASLQESFTLEELKVLILTYRRRNKDFILARVTTQDVEDSNVFYNFYYSAAEINRILFRYEPARHLLHRMKVKNPLNNMYIIGQVYYYKITRHEIDKAIINYLFNTKQDKEQVHKAFSAVFRKQLESYSQERISKSKDLMDIEESLTETNENVEIEAREVVEKLAKGDLKIPPVSDKNRKMQYKARYFASDDDFLIKQEVREYFKRNQLEAEDDFLYDLDRANNDLLVLPDDSQEEDIGDESDWQQVLSAHGSISIVLLFMCLLMGGGPAVALIFLPIAVFIFLSFISSLMYVMCCRRGTTESLNVQSVEDEL